MARSRSPSVARAHRAVRAAALAASLVTAPLPAGSHPEELVESLLDPKNEERAPAPVDSSTGKPLWQLNAGVPFVGSPVHEQMTVAAINLSRVHERAYRVEYDDAYIHGVFWPDDPDNLLCPECSAFNLLRFDKRWGLAFAARFKAASERARGGAAGPGTVFGVGDGLLERSHFGDLQFMHAMAAADGERAEVTQARMLDWAQFAYQVATGSIDQTTRLDRVPIPSVRAYFQGDAVLASKSIEQLFKDRRHVKRAMAGVLLHMVQDSYAGGHAERELLEVRGPDGAPRFARGRILRFHSYANQDSGLHGADDRWPSGLPAHGIEGDTNPIGVGARLLQFIYSRDGEGESWENVHAYLRDIVFAISDPDALSGPGDKYRRK